jgi:hypothetical protein
MRSPSKTFRAQVRIRARYWAELSASRHLRTSLQLAALRESMAHAQRHTYRIGPERRRRGPTDLADLICQLRAGLQAEGASRGAHSGGSARSYPPGFALPAAGSCHGAISLAVFLCSAALGMNIRSCREWVGQSARLAGRTACGAARGLLAEAPAAARRLERPGRG